MRGGSMFLFEELSELPAPTEDAYSEKNMNLPGTPKSTLDHWNFLNPTHLMRVVPEVCCLRLVSNITKEHNQCFVAHAQAQKGAGAGGECTRGSHADLDRLWGVSIL